jgi:hypothetical protein
MRLDALAACVAVAVTMMAFSGGLPAPAWGQVPQPPAQPQPPMQPPAQPLSPAPPTPADPRLAQVRSAVERLGQKVLDVAIVRQTSGNVGWIVVTPAAYGQPSFEAVFRQAQTVWWGTWGTASAEPPDTTILVNGQVWNRFIINQFVKARDYATFLSSYQAARNDADRARVFDVLWDTTSYSVFDMERRQYVDAKDFSNKNFTR